MTFDDLEAADPAFADRVRPDPRPGGCWWWVGALIPTGYGRAWHDGRAVAAHRRAYELATASPPPGVLRHACDHPSCVNPAHLEPGDQRANLADASRRGRLGSRRVSVVDRRGPGGQARAVRAALAEHFDAGALDAALEAGAPAQLRLAV